jgi:hypothetical protein
MCDVRENKLLNNAVLHNWQEELSKSAPPCLIEGNNITMVRALLIDIGIYLQSILLGSVTMVNNEFRQAVILAFTTLSSRPTPRLQRSYKLKSKARSSHTTGTA